MREVYKVICPNCDYMYKLYELHNEEKPCGECEHVYLQEDSCLKMYEFVYDAHRVCKGDER